MTREVILVYTAEEIINMIDTHANLDSIEDMEEIIQKVVQILKTVL